jgi:hypothetical protein
MPGPHQNIQSLGAGGLYGGNTVGGGGIPVARSDLDAARMAFGRTPYADYPDGYLGTIRLRRDKRGQPMSTSEKVLAGVAVRVTQRSYQRGVHKGSRIDPQDYYWPDRLQPDRGLRNQMRNQRTAPLMDLAPAPHLVNDGKADRRAASGPVVLDAQRLAQLGRIRPTWR